MNTKLLLSMFFFPLLPLLILCANGLHFLLTPAKRRKPFLFPPFTTWRDYFILNWLFAIAMVTSIASLFWDVLTALAAVLTTAWFIYINIFAIIRRKKQKAEQEAPSKGDD